MARNKLMHILVILTTLVCFSGLADAAVTVTGTLDADYPTWSRGSDRPDGSGGYLDSANDNLPYEVLQIRTTVPGDTLTATIGGSTGFDSFLALYSSFSLAQPLVNILAVDDDSAGYPHAMLTKSGLAANTGYYLVITSYASGADAVYPLYGSYSLMLGGGFSVVPYVTTTTVNAAPNPAAYGQDITLTATVPRTPGGAPPTGTVTFRDGAVDIGSGTLNGSGQASLTVSNMTEGIHSISALYGGELKYTASTSAPVSVTINPPIYHTLSVNFAGPGDNKIESTSPDQSINCLKGSTGGCSASFISGTPVTLKATPDWKSVFTSWSGDFTGSTNPLTLTVDGDKSVTATFGPAANARIVVQDYATLLEAYTAAPSGATILMKNIVFLENVVVEPASSATIYTLKGGFADFAGSAVGYSTIKGSLKVRKGKLIVNRLNVKQ